MLIFCLFPFFFFFFFTAVLLWQSRTSRWSTTPTFPGKWWGPIQIVVSKENKGQQLIAHSVKMLCNDEGICLCFIEGPCWKQVSCPVWWLPICTAWLQCQLAHFNDLPVHNALSSQCHRLCHPQVSHEVLQHHRQCEDGRYLSHLMLLPTPSSVSFRFFHQSVTPHAICYYQNFWQLQ